MLSSTLSIVQLGLKNLGGFIFEASQRVSIAAIARRGTRP